MTDIVYRLQALIPATQDMESTSAAETIEEGCGEIFNLRGMLKQVRQERDEARAALATARRDAIDEVLHELDGLHESPWSSQVIVNKCIEVVQEVKDRTP